MVQVQLIEVTQAIQDVGNTVPLIANRRTIVRVYLGAERGWTVRGVLRVQSACGDTMVSSVNVLTIDTAMNRKLALKRSTVNGSLNFVIPACEGNVSITVDNIVRVPNNLPLLIEQSGGSTQVAFRPKTTLPLCIVNIPYKLKDGTVLMPRPVDYRLLRSWLLRAFPVSELSVRTGVADTIYEDSSYVNGVDDKAWNHLVSFVKVDQQLRCDQRSHYYGMIFDDGRHFVRGIKRKNPSAGAPPPSFGPTGVPVDKYMWDSDSSYGDWYGAHEIAHQFYRFHIGCGLQNDQVMDADYPYAGGFLSDDAHTYIGFDVGDPVNAPEIPMRPLRWDIHHDVMSYSVDLWTSDYTYRAILTQLKREEENGELPVRPDIGKRVTVVVGGAPVSVKCPGGQSIIVVGTIDIATGTGEISDVTHLANSSASSSTAGSRVTLRLIDTAGQKLNDDHGARINEISEDCESDDCPGTLSIEEVIPDVDGIDRIELRLDHQVIAAWKVPHIADQRDAPTTISRTSTGVVVRWPTLPVSEDNRNYLVQESLDGGMTWFLLAIERGSPGVVLERALYKGVDSVLLRVIDDGGADSKERARATVSF